MQGEFVNFRWIAVNQFSLEKRHSFYSFTHLLLLNLFQANPSSHQRRAGHTLDKSSLHHRATFTPWGDLHWTMNLTNSHTHIHRKLHSTTTVHSATAHLFYLLCKSNVVYLYASDLVCGADIFTVLRYVCWTFDPILWLSPPRVSVDWHASEDYCLCGTEVEMLRLKGFPSVIVKTKTTAVFLEM